MDKLFLEISGVIFSYILGSIPTAVWIGKLFYKTDVRKQGSGNSGATNTLRVLGAKAGLLVLIIDIFKGFAALNLVDFLDFKSNGENVFYFQTIFGLCALIGHIFPLFANFKGGKGVATLFGVIIGLHYDIAIICFIIFFIVFIFSKYVSLSSIITSILYPIFVIIFFNTQHISFVFFSLIVAIVVPLTHYKNIERLLKKEESKIDLFKKKQK